MFAVVCCIGSLPQVSSTASRGDLLHPTATEPGLFRLSAQCPCISGQLPFRGEPRRSQVQYTRDTPELRTC